MDKEQESSGNKMVGKLVTDELREAWKNFMEKFQQSFDVDQLDSVLSFLRESESNGQNPSKKKRVQLMESETETNDDDDNTTSLLEKKVFGNHLLSKPVFKYLSKTDLLSCRLMSSYWNEYATHVLLQTDLRVNFMRRTDSNRFYKREEISDIVNNCKTLDMFTQLLRTSKQFPCNKFVFWGGNLGNYDARLFFSFYGPSIKSLTINLNDPDLRNDRAKSEAGFSMSLTDSRTIGIMLSQQLENLEDFTLNSYCKNEFSWSGYRHLLFPPEEKVELPNLKRIASDSRQDYDEALFRQLLVAATNLERFELNSSYFDVESLDDFTETGKVKCITDLSFPTEADELDKLEEMLKHEPQLSILHVLGLAGVYGKSKNWTRISRLLSQLLNCSQKSLEELQGLSSFGFLPHFQLPVLQNVKDLDLEVVNKSDFNAEDVHDYSFSILPRGATFSRNFPRLQTVELNVESEISDEDAAEWWTKCFPTDEIVSSVKTLEVGHFVPVLWMEKLGKMFPYLEELEVGYIKDFPSFSKIVWTSCRKLKSLEFGIDTSSPLNAHPALDSSFTGLSPEVCNQLEPFSSSELESVAENYMGHAPSLLDLTDLQTLKINLAFESDVSNLNYSKVLAPLTGICVFKPLQSLQEVNIDFNGYKPLILQDLEQLKPYKVKIT